MWLWPMLRLLLSADAAVGVLIFFVFSFHWCFFIFVSECLTNAFEELSDFLALGLFLDYFLQWLFLFEFFSWNNLRSALFSSAESTWESIFFLVPCLSFPWVFHFGFNSWDTLGSVQFSSVYYQWIHMGMFLGLCLLFLWLLHNGFQSWD